MNTNDEKPKKKRLTARQQKFVQHYANGLSGTDAVIAANYNCTSNNTASSMASQLLDLEHVQEALQIALASDFPDIHKEAARTIYSILRSEESTPSEKLKAIDTLSKIFNWYKAPQTETRSQPNTIRDYFKLPEE